ncbi:MAG: sulfotransferase [Gammaproteobacteria bacterium]|nr:sulfotransferase [Gammaproteobacteria bacterium]
MAFESKYSLLDGILHSLAFKSWPVQAAVSDIEDRLFKAELDKINIEKPVFITALPRAGTTLMLELCVSQGEFTSHSYRDMPFVLSPMFWHKFSTKFQQSDIPRERAHGDGMLVNVDSPEAFEEVVWRTFWESHYKKDRIVPWSNEEDAEFYRFFYNHLKKIVAIHSGAARQHTRYVSKNNLNIARIDALLANVSDAVIILPFREPLQHAASLLKQHRNFLKIHNEDPFALSYMKAIGHYGFGEI